MHRLQPRGSARTVQRWGVERFLVGVRAAEYIVIRVRTDDRSPWNLRRVRTSYTVASRLTTCIGCNDSPCVFSPRLFQREDRHSHTATRTGHIAHIQRHNYYDLYSRCVRACSSRPSRMRTCYTMHEQSHLSGSDNSNVWHKTMINESTEVQTLGVIRIQLIYSINVLSKYSSLISHRPSIFEGRHIDHRSSKVNTSISEGRHIDLRRSTHRSPKVDTSIFEGRHIVTSIVDLRKAIHRSSKVATSIFEDRRQKHHTYNSPPNIVHNCPPSP